MNPELDITPSKTHRDENFPVASILIAPRHRPTILAFYGFVRSADDIADHAHLTPDEKLAALDRYAAALLGKDDSVEVARPLRAVLAEQRLSPRHALDVLEAFRMDAVKKRYADWDELMHYCSYSAAPVGRFVLDVHGESENTWAASDALCSALQVINHLQDCAEDYADLDRVYLPRDAMQYAGIGVEALGAEAASPALRACLKGLAERTGSLLHKGMDLPRQVRDLRLGFETAVILRLARVLTRKLLVHDPLSEELHLSKPAFLGWSLVGLFDGLVARGRRSASLQSSQMRDA
jgi:hydroxysqualene synthase